MKALWSRLSAIKHFDKVLHFGACFVLSLYQWDVALAAAIAKEYGDYNNPNSGWSWWDIVADALGIGTGLIIKQ
jgi:hypothetical protein